MQKVPGITSVKVSLNDGLTVLDFAPDNNVTLGQLRQLIRNNGFVTNESRIVARGSIARLSGAVTFEVRGSKERFAVPDAVITDRTDAVVTGTANTKDPAKMTLTAIKVETP